MRYFALFLVYASAAVTGYGLYLIHPALGWIAAGFAVLLFAGWLLSVENQRKADRLAGRPIPMRPAGGYKGCGGDCKGCEKIRLHP